MNRKDGVLAGVCAAAALWALWPSWADTRWIPANFGDLVGYHHPMRHLVAESLATGHLPFWNAYIFSGLPLSSNPQAVLLYPVAVLGYVLPLTVALSWDMALHLFWAMLGTAALGRRAGLSAARAWTLGLLYALCPFVVYRVTAGIPTLLASLSWVPWCWLAWSAGRPGWLGAAWALQLLSGHPQFLIVNAAGMALWAALSARPLRRLKGLAVEALWTTGLTAIQWLPTWEFLGLSVRRSWPAAYSLGYSLDLSSLATLLYPGALGDPIARTFSGPPSVFFETCGLWIGFGGLAAACAGLWLGRRRAAPLALIAAGVLLALGANNPLYRAALGAGLSLLRTASRWLELSLWGLVLCAGAGLARLPRGRGLGLAAFALALVELCGWNARFLGRQQAAEFLSSSYAFAHIVGDQPQRLITDPDMSNPNKSALYHARNANGYEAFYLDGYPQYVARSEGKAAADASRTYLSRIGTPEMDRLGVLWRRGADGILERSKTALPLAYFLDESGRRTGTNPMLYLERPERWAVRGVWPAAARRLVIAQPFYPGWTAWLNGAPATLTLFDGLLQSIDRDGRQGFFRLDLGYAPSGWPLWAAVTLLCWAHWLARRREGAW